MELLTSEIKYKIDSSIIDNIKSHKLNEAETGVNEVISLLHQNIPSKNRISYGIVYTVKILSQFLYDSLQESVFPVFETFSEMFEKSLDFKSRTVYLGILTNFGLNDFEGILPFFEKASSDKDWNVREISQMFFRRIIKKYPSESKTFLLKLVQSPDENQRRFAGETLRPVCENKWFYESPDYPLSIIKYLFNEKKPYPRTSAGNNLSDLSRKLPDLVYQIVEELVKSNDKNSYWIAYRACRNLVKKEPLKVMELLKTEEYKYKNKIYKKIDY